MSSISSTSRPTRSTARSRLSSQNSAVVSNGVKDTHDEAEASRSPTATRSSKRVIKLTNKMRNQDQLEGQNNKKQKVDKEEEEEQSTLTEVKEGNLEEEEKAEMKLYERWAEEYYEIVEQLPLELHRTFTLMKELEHKMQDRISTTASHVLAYRNARIALRSQLRQEGGEEKVEEEKKDRQGGGDDVLEEQEEQPAMKFHSDIVHPDYGSSSDQDAEGEDDEEIFHEVQASMSEELASRVVLEVTPSASELAKRDRQIILRKIADSSLEAIRAADEKVGLAVTAYNWVDRHIRRLDGDLQRSESSLLLGLRAGTEASRGVRDALGISEGDNLYNRKDGQAGWNDDTLISNQSTPIPSALARKKGRNKDADDTAISTSLMTDMAIDPNEPKYCYCDEVSSGDMVACDNEDCPREWFHYHCVGLTGPPKGRWYCLFCAPPGCKGSGTFPPNAPCLPPGYGSKRGDGNASGEQAKKTNGSKGKKK